MDKELIVVKGQVIEQQKAYTTKTGKEISYETGAKMVKRHFDANPDDVMAHFVGRTAVEKILSQPGCIGMRMFYAVKDMGIRTLVLVGVDKNGNSMIELDAADSTTLSKKQGVIISGVRDCPPYCGDSGSSIGWV